MSSIREVREIGTYIKHDLSFDVSQHAKHDYEMYS